MNIDGIEFELPDLPDGLFFRIHPVRPVLGSDRAKVELRERRLFGSRVLEWGLVNPRADLPADVAVDHAVWTLWQRYETNHADAIEIKAFSKFEGDHA